MPGDVLRRVNAKLGTELFAQAQHAVYGDGYKHAGDKYLQGHQHAGEAIGRLAPATLVGIFQRFIAVYARGLPGGKQARRQPGEDGERAPNK